MNLKGKIYNAIPKKIIPEKIPVYSDNLLGNNVVLVIGATGGIGTAISKMCLEHGAYVIMHGTNEHKLKALSKGLGKAKNIAFDLRNFNDYHKFFNKCVGLFGKIDSIVLSAGIHGHDSFGNVSSHTWDSVMELNLKSPYLLAQEFSNYLIENKRKGHILFVSSASCAKPGWTPYEISKAGVRSMTLGMADKLIKYGIVVNSIAPGPVATQMLGHRPDSSIEWRGNPAGRMATPEEIANISCIMLSDMGNLIVGDTFFVSGGSGTICIDK